MKHLFLFLILFLTANFLFAQGRIGYTKEEIISDFYLKNFESDITTGGVPYIYADFGNALIAYYFDEDGYCFLTRVIPYSQGAINYYAEKYNDQYAIISDTHWKAYLEDGGILNIYLVPAQNGGSAYFDIQR